jgi:hypothetical protein
MSNLGLGMIAAGAAIDEQKAQELRDQRNQRFDWEKQKAQSELSLLDDKAAAERSGYQNTVGVNAAAKEVRPLETANEKAQLGIDAVSLRNAANRQPTLEQTKDNEAIAAEGVSKVKAALQGVQSDRIPQLVNNARTQGVIDDAASSKLIGASIADMVDRGDQQGIVSLLNAQKQASSDPKITELPDVAAVAKAKDAQGNEVLILKDAAGNQIKTRPMSDFYAARDSLAKPEVKNVNAGDSLVSVRGDKATPLYTAPGNPAKDSRPAEARLTDYFISIGVPPDEAARRASRLKDMSPANAVLELYKINLQALPANASEADRQKALKTAQTDVDAIFPNKTPEKNGSLGANGAQSTRPANPKINKVIGLN